MCYMVQQLLQFWKDFRCPCIRRLLLIKLRSSCSLIFWMIFFVSVCYAVHQFYLENFSLSMFDLISSKLFSISNLFHHIRYSTICSYFCDPDYIRFVPVIVLSVFLSTAFIICFVLVVLLHVSTLMVNILTMLLTVIYLFHHITSFSVMAAFSCYVFITPKYLYHQPCFSVFPGSGIIRIFQELLRFEYGLSRTVEAVELSSPNFKELKILLRRQNIIIRAKTNF